jgi:hypothetical protein
MRKLLLLFILSSLFSIVNGQTVITGKVTDNKNNPVVGASITIKNSYDGAVSDSAGKFRFSTTEKGEQLLTISGVGYKIFEQKVNLTGTAINLDVSLKEEINEMKAVVITAGAFEASDKKRSTVLNSIDIVTTASANADITGAIKTLPGSQQVGESEGLFVRGGTAGETRTYIDGTLVNNFFYTSVPNIAQRGRFSPFIFKGTVFSAGGYSALYGQALSSALILETIDFPDQSSGTISISPLGGAVGLQKLGKDKKSSWGVNYGYTFLDIAFKVLENKVDYFRLPTFHTADANFRIKTSNSGILKYYGYMSQNHLGLRRFSLDTLGYKESFELKNFNIYQNLSWRENLGSYWKLNAGISYTNNKDDITGATLNGSNSKTLLQGLEFKNFDLDSRANYFNAKLVLDRRLRGLSAVRGGVEYNYTDDKAGYTLYNGMKYPNNYLDDMVSGFAEADIYVTNDLAAKLGSRLEHSSFLNKINLAPRASLAYKVGKEAQASVAYGIFYQNPERRYLPSPNDLTFQKATHYILQYQKVSALQTFRAETFYKKYDNLMKTSFINNTELAASNNGYGYAKGVEFFWRDKKSVKNFDYWLSYSYLDTKRDFLNYPLELEPNFASKHTGNIVLKKFLTKMRTQVNANYVFATGRPYYNLQYDNSINKYRIADQGKTINYNSLSLSLNYLPNVFTEGSKKFTVLVFSVTNVLGTNQVFGYNYSYNGLRKEAIVPPTKTFMYIGAFISFGVDRTEEVINNNL